MVIVNDIAAYIKEGCKSRENGFYLGIELEHFVIDSCGRSVSYYGGKGVEAVLKKMSVFYDEEIYSDGHLVGLKGGDLLISLEPGAQLEISISPKAHMSEIVEAYSRFIDMALPALKEFGYSLALCGYRPHSKAEDIETIPKKRYRYMEEHFAAIGPFGRYMMKGTAATQISIDYYSERDFAEKYMAAVVLAPVFSLLCDNSPVFEGEPNTKPLLRARIWDGVDPERTDISRHFSLEGVSFEAYAGYAVGVPLIFRHENGECIKCGQSFGEVYSGKKASISEIEHALSMVFPDVRVKKFIEIRCADSMPIELSVSYAALIKGLFMDTGALIKCVSELKAGSLSDVAAAKESIMAYGASGRAYGAEVAVLVRRLFEIAGGNLGKDEREYLRPLESKWKEVLQKNAHEKN